MIPQNKIREVIGHTKTKKGKHPLSGNQSRFDSDKDGYINSIDCDPRNPNKDGFISDTISAGKNWVRKKAGEVKETSGKFIKDKEERRVKERALKREAKEEYEKAYFEERKKYLEKQAREKAKAKAQRPSIGQQLMKGIDNNLKQGSKVIGSKKKELSFNDKLGDLLKGTDTTTKKKSERIKALPTPKDFKFKII